MIIVPVVACVAMALCAIYMGLVDLYGSWHQLSTARSAVRGKALAGIVGALDAFLVASVLIVAAFGLYELFVGKIEAAERSEVAPRLLKIESLEDLKQKVAKLLVVILAVEFFKQAVNLSYASALELLYLAGAILLVSLALYIIGRRG